ncbi:thioredoxin family protein [Flavobacterium praedii]|uniref:thioredoxin family protein n=1 Tax=Flavobacterium praedii TaxID=3002900 RepID=UPI002481C621|nr:thioredoxin family protein [Flavobacterium praedii]
MSTEIKILHSSCCGAKSSIREQLITIAQKNKLDITITELFDLQDTMVFETLTFPSLVVNGKVYDYKKIKTDEQLISIL